MKYLYYCNSTYQIINAINLNWHRKNAGFESIDNYSADLVILNAFPNADKIAESIKKTKSFNNVFIVERVKNEGALHLFKTIYGIVNPLFFLKKSGILNPLKLKGEYDYIVVPKFSKTSAAIWQLNKKAELHLYEDGFGSYDGVMLMKGLIPSNKTYRYIYKIFNYGKSFDCFSRLYLNEKSMFHNGDFDKVIQTPKMSTDLLGEIKELFSYSDNIYGNKKIIWFGQPIDAENIDSTKKVLMSYKDDVLYKPHPRYGGNIEDFDKIDTSRVWEVDALNIDNINKLCLVTCDSTAVFTPKILFDFEPYVIFTFNILGKKEESDVMMGESFINTYRNKEKILIPNSISELYNSIETYYKNRN